MFGIETVDDLYNHIGYVLLCAPNDFPKEDYLPEEHQMTLDMAFDQLRQGVEIAYPEASFESKKELLYSIIDKCYEAYVAGDQYKGAHLLQDFQDQIFKTT